MYKSALGGAAAGLTVAGVADWLIPAGEPGLEERHDRRILRYAKDYPSLFDDNVAANARKRHAGRVRKRLLLQGVGYGGAGLVGAGIGSAGYGITQAIKKWARGKTRHTYRLSARSRSGKRHRGYISRRTVVRRRRR